MLVNPEMEKKLVRLNQCPKGIDVKKVQDVPQAKLFAKSQKKRESSGDSRKTNAVQKSHHDKRPAARKAGNNSGTAIAQLEEQLEDLGVGTSKSKKKNVNHLLNFQCKPRNDPFMYGEPRSSLSNVVHNINTQKHKYNKEQFLQASCQFVVRAQEDYSIHLADPDILVDWELVEQLRVMSPEGINCPICLYPPVAAKITRCGHIYCWACVLHFLSLTDNAWQKCPICFESIYQKDLKSVHIIERKPISVGDVLTFQLMKKEKGSTVVIPVSEINSRTTDNFLVASESEHTTVYSKILLADYQNVLKIVEEEENELQAQLLEYEHCPEYCFVVNAINLLKQRKNFLLEELEKAQSKPAISNMIEDVDDNTFGDVTDWSNISPLDPVHEKITYVSAFDDIKVTSQTSNSVPNEENVENVSNPEFDENESLTKRQRYESVSSNGEDTLNSPINPEDLELPACTTPSLPPKEFFFYQSEDGQQIFMHSLNARMLVMSYGGLDKAPLKIQGTVLEKESGSMTDELRKRLRYLEHLPITSVFEVVEIKMQPPLITDETEAFFIAQVEKRYRRRYRRTREENKIEKKVKEMEQIRYGRHKPPPRLHLESLQDFPECGSDTPPNMSPKNRSPRSSRTNSPQRSISPVNNTASMRMNNSFAQKLKCSNTGDGCNNVWKRRTTPCMSTAEDNQHQSPSNGCNLGEAVEAAFKKANLEKNENQLQKGKKKKKKPKPIPLCSVGMVYSQR